MNSTPVIDMFSGTGELARAVSAGLVEPTRPVSFSDNYGPPHAPTRTHRRQRHERNPLMAFTLKRVKPEALEVGDIIHADPCDLEITHIRPDTTARGETEYVLSATHYFFVWPVESTIRVRADNYLQLKKRG